MCFDGHVLKAAPSHQPNRSGQGTVGPHRCHSQHRGKDLRSSRTPCRPAAHLAPSPGSGAEALALPAVQAVRLRQGQHHPSLVVPPPRPHHHGNPGGVVTYENRCSSRGIPSPPSKAATASSGPDSQALFLPEPAVRASTFQEALPEQAHLRVIIMTWCVRPAESSLLLVYYSSAVTSLLRPKLLLHLPLSLADFLTEAFNPEIELQRDSLRPLGLSFLVYTPGIPPLPCRAISKFRS